jgi:hypothetical protein
MDGEIDGFIEAYLKKKSAKGGATLSVVAEADDL